MTESTSELTIFAVLASGFGWLVWLGLRNSRATGGVQRPVGLFVDPGDAHYNLTVTSFAQQ